MADTRLHRTVNGRVIGGVAGGLADFFSMDPTIVRLIFVLLAVFGGGGVLLYIILWIVLPERNSFNTYSAYSTPPPSATTNATGSADSGVGDTFEGFGKPNQDFSAAPETVTRRKFEGSLIGGIVLILIGSFFLAERFIPQISFGDFWPLLLVVVGLVLIFNSLPIMKKNRNESGEL
jgi:phage shock protein PspC (stress-responsive transcriptional regulator)